MNTPEQIPGDYLDLAREEASKMKGRSFDYLDAAMTMVAWAYRHLSSTPSDTGARWVKCLDRMPVLPDPLPADTPEERPVVFMNIRHSCMQPWFPSYGWPAEKQFPLEKDVNRDLYDEGFGREHWEWLDESAPAPLQEKGIREAELIDWLEKGVRYLRNGVGIADAYDRGYHKAYEEVISHVKSISPSSPLPLSDKK